jgi:two-component sensor histidine kinase
MKPNTHTQFLLFVSDCAGNFIDVKTSGLSFSGYRKNEIKKSSMHNFFLKTELRRKPLRYDLLLKGKTVLAEPALPRKDQSEVVIGSNTRRKSIGIYQAITRNVAARIKAEDSLLKDQANQQKIQLEKANSELKRVNAQRIHTEDLLMLQIKENNILLKEIHHRVKNNMQVIISLLNLQADSISDPRLLELFTESQNRIMSIALIHEKLCQSKNMTHIDFSEYVSSLTNHLSHSFHIGDRTIEIFTKTQKIPLEFDTVITLGLIVNELVSNSIKYAFNDIRNGKVEISLKKTKGNLLHLTVSDNGVGIPEYVNFRDAKSLGLQLVCSLTEQISGNISLLRENGTKFCIQFPHQLKL